MPSAPRTRKLKITRTASLFDCEEALKNLVSSGEPASLLISSENRGIFFKDLRVAAIISAASQTANVECKWHPQLSKQTHRSLVGLAGAVYGVPYTEGQVFASAKMARRILAQRLDILEDPPGTKETLTFCAIDHTTRAQPIALSGLSGKTEFESQFGNYVREYFDRGVSSSFTNRIGPSLFDDGASISACMFGFVFELYQNSYNHGTLDVNQTIIPGLRIIRMRKRIGNWGSREAFIRGADKFSELERYLNEVVPRKKTFKFYEVSITDNGMGILSRFRTTTRIGQQRVSSRTDDIRLLNRIVAESLSSDERKSNVGEGGLKRALRAVDTIRGFVSLRTDDLWVYRSPLDDSEKSDYDWLIPVKESNDLSRIPGTHFSMIFLAS